MTLALIGALSFAAASVLWLAPAAVGAAPANDDFADAQALSSTLPVEVAGTTVGSTAEVKEPVPDGFEFAATGRTVWYEWEATSSGFVTASTCGSQTGNVLGVYTGTAVDALTEVAGGFPSLGPDCSTFRGTAVTFKAVGGVTYALLVEGRPTFPEEESPGEGPFLLELEATSLPTNDDFAEATVLQGQVLENGVYAAGASGFNWNATKEPGEPAHADDPGGASVWYSWTAPSTGEFSISSCARFATVLFGVYTGGSVDSLSRVVSRRDCGISTLSAGAGMTYHIALDGKLDTGSGYPALGALWVNVYRMPPEPTPRTYESIVEPERRTHLPRTTIRKKTVKPARGRATIFFRSSEPDATFRCRLDGRRFSACASPKTYRGLKVGKHDFAVFAVDAAGNADPTPALVRFTIPARDRGDR